jgi:hypothetical protein
LWQNGHSVKWNKPDTEREIPYVLFHMWKYGSLNKVNLYVEE